MNLAEYEASLEKSGGITVPVKKHEQAASLFSQRVKPLYMCTTEERGVIETPNVSSVK